MSATREPVSPVSMPPQGFEVLLSAHDTLEQAFQMHQELLVLREGTHALGVLKAYQSLLWVHLKQEEELLMPIFEREPAHPKWPSVLYTGQHRKMLGMLAACVSGLERVAQREPLAPGFVVALLDRENTFKHLVEHHDGAERHGFFPALDAKATASERAELVERCDREFQRATLEVAAVLAAGRRCLSASEQQAG